MPSAPKKPVPSTSPKLGSENPERLNSKARITRQHFSKTWSNKKQCFGPKTHRRSMRIVYTHKDGAWLKLNMAKSGTQISHQRRRWGLGRGRGLVCGVEGDCICSFFLAISPYKVAHINKRGITYCSCNHVLARLRLGPERLSLGLVWSGLGHRQATPQRGAVGPSEAGEQQIQYRQLASRAPNYFSNQLMGKGNEKST